MHTTEIIIGLLVAVAAVAWVANRLRVPYPILLVIGGLGLALVPRLPQVELQPEHVFLLFLPPLLYYAGLHTSWRDFKANARPIALLAVGLVLFTTVLVAAVAHFVVGMSWPTSFVLGAIVSPPDAVAATAILQRLRVPRRIVTILEGESLVNDATALVTYQFAVAAVVTGSFSLAHASLQFVIVSVGGVIVGLLAGMTIAWVRPRLRDNSVEHIVSLLTPYVAYLPAEWLHVSGVLAVVTCGIYIARRLGRITTAEIRLRSWAVWDAFNFLLEGLVFILVGLQISRILKDLPPGTRFMWAVVVSLVAIVARLLWVPAATYLPRLLSKRMAERDPIPPKKNIFLVAWTQMRGVVSLAAALALPMTTANGAEFPDRAKIAFLTFGVILFTLVGQGLTLPAIIRYLGLDRGRDEGADEENTARYLAALAAIERLDALGATDAEAAAALQRARAEYDERIAYYSRTISPADGSDGVGGAMVMACSSHEDAMRQAIQAQRDMLGRLRDQGVIGDDVLRHLEQELDHEEARMLE